MPDGKPTKAPIIIFGTMVTMSIVSVSTVFYTHSQRTEPYLDNKMRRVKQVEFPEDREVEAPTSDPAAVLDGGSTPPQ
ncbi:MAG: hypothetical protein GY811_00625 [Myxococcales bacterium]|nr:hypothetical protein [Myxococcales bacterium]